MVKYGNDCLTVISSEGVFIDYHRKSGLQISLWNFVLAFEVLYKVNINKLWLTVVNYSLSEHEEC